jgi:hypothetical protein
MNDIEGHSGQQDSGHLQAAKDFAVSVVGGEEFGQLLVLYAVPAAYSVGLDDLDLAPGQILEQGALNLGGVRPFRKLVRRILNAIIE